MTIVTRVDWSQHVSGAPVTAGVRESVSVGVAAIRHLADNTEDEDNTSESNVSPE